MAQSRTPQEPAGRRLPAATTPEARENQLISLAYDRAEQQIADGTASAQVLSHFLKAGSTRDRLEKERIAKENKLVDAKIESMASTARVEELYENAMNAMKGYQGMEVPQEEEDEYYDY